MHNRRGPGVLQEYRDLFKLLTRQSVAPDAAGWVFRLTPFVMVGDADHRHRAAGGDGGSPLPVLGDLITLIYLFAIARFFFAIAGLDTGSPFTGIGASREAMLGVLVEPILLLGLWVAAQVAGSTHISFITDTVYHWPVPAPFRWFWRCAPARSPPLLRWANCRLTSRKQSRSCRKGR
jgi:formate hydrogenlyase subunit 4